MWSILHVINDNWSLITNIKHTSIVLKKWISQMLIWIIENKHKRFINWKIVKQYLFEKINILGFFQRFKNLSYEFIK